MRFSFNLIDILIHITYCLLCSQFFKPIVPVNILLLTDDAGRSSGEADVEFSSVDDAQRALQRHKSNMGDRYIELYMEEGTSSKEANGRGTGGFGGKYFLSL